MHQMCIATIFGLILSYNIIYSFREVEKFLIDTNINNIKEKKDSKYPPQYFYKYTRTLQSRNYKHFPIFFLCISRGLEFSNPSLIRILCLFTHFSSHTSFIQEIISIHLVQGASTHLLHFFNETNGNNIIETFAQIKLNSYVGIKKNILRDAFYFKSLFYVSSLITIIGNAYSKTILEFIQFFQ